MNMATTRPEQKTATQGPALNENPRYRWLNSDKMDGSIENGIVKKWRLELKMAERSEERYDKPSSLNNSGETAIATAPENSKIKIKASKIEQWLS